MKVVMVASECNPLCKTGGLADVIYSLSRELANEGHEVYVFLPLYKKIMEKYKNFEYVLYDYVDMSWRHQYIGLFKTKIDGINFYLVDNEQYFGRDGFYGYDDDGERFAYFTRAVQRLIHTLSLKPDIVHVHDWQAGMLPALMKAAPLDDHKSHYVLTIHNPAFKGYLYRESLPDLYNLSEKMYDDGAVRLEGMVSTLKAGIYFADKITTVSPTHRNELLTEELSQGLSGVLNFRRDDFCGVVNGIDVVEFDPATDKKIAKNYDDKTFKVGKKACKKALISQFGLENEDAPLFGLVSRLTWQKGIDLILKNAEHLIYRGANLIFLGNGENNLEQAVQELRNKYPNKVAIYLGYSDDLAHKIYAGSDFFFMPSLFEPCGIGQIIAQRYGTLPLARETGGLVDTVHAEIDGFTFHDYDFMAMRYVIDRAIDVYYDKKFMDKLVANAMKLDRSWVSSCQIYLGIYKELINK